MTFIMIEFFCENDYWLRDVNYFRQKVSLLMFLIFIYFYIIIDIFYNQNHTFQAGFVMFRNPIFAMISLAKNFPLTFKAAEPRCMKSIYQQAEISAKKNWIVLMVNSRLYSFTKIMPLIENGFNLSWCCCIMMLLKAIYCNKVKSTYF